MANGDKAAAAGLAVFPGTQDRRQGYDNDNIRGDELAEHMTAGTHPADKIVGPSKLAAAVIPATLPGLNDIGAVGNQIRIRGTAIFPNAPAVTVAPNVYIDANGILARTSGGAATPNQLNDGGALFNWNGAEWASSAGLRAAGRVVSPGSRAFTVVTSWASAAIDGAGTLGVQPSARRFKKNIKPLTLDDTRIDAFLSIPAVEYDLKVGIGGKATDPKRLGFIAEDVLDAGFDDWVPIDTDESSDTYGQPISVNYAQAVVPLQLAAKRDAARIAQLEADVAELRAQVATLLERNAS